MPVRIDSVGPDSDRDLADAAAVETAYWREVLGPDEPPYPPAAVPHELLQVGRTGIDATALVARDGDRPVGLAVVDIRTGFGNEHLAWVPDLYVVEADRRRGTGRRLLDAVIDVATAAGRTLVIGGRPDGHPAGEAFADAVGARRGNGERQNRVAVDRLDRALLERWVGDAGEHATGYSLMAFDDVVPDDLLDAYVAVENVMNDAPRSASLEPFAHNVERTRGGEAFRALHGIRQWVVCARHDASGDLVGYTELTISPHRPWLVHQGDTAVAPAHRGHRLGRWLKATNALRILDELQGARVLETWNDGTNAPMLAINTDMGFRPVATWIDAELQLP